MPDQDASQAAELHNPDFHHVLKALLAAYLPVIEQQLDLARDPEKLEREARSGPPDCEEEFAEAHRLFGEFLTEDIALRLIPVNKRGGAGSIERWRPCLLQVRCCILFGWLVCRGPRTHRAWAYAIYQYWQCVRRSLGNPIADPPTEEQRADFAVLIRALAKAYKPYLTEEAASVDLSSTIPGKLFEGEIDCSTGQDETAGIFDRLLTTEVTEALLGKAAFVSEIRDPNYFLCRCWCLCSLGFGCCLARCRTLLEVRWCLAYYFRCLEECFQPLACQIATPTAGACVDTTVVAVCGDAVAVEIAGTATGSSFNHYTLTYSWGGGSPVSDAVIYPDCGRPPATNSSTTPVTAGVLGYLDAFLLPPGVTEFTVYLNVCDANGTCTECTRTFQLKYEAIAITAAAAVVATPLPDPFQPPAPPPAPVKVIPAVSNPGFELSIGGAFSIYGSAYTAGCNRILSQFQLFEFPLSPLGLTPPPVPTFLSGAGGVPLGPPPVQPVVYMDNPATHPWNSGCFAPVPNTIENGNLVAQWGTESCFQFVPLPLPGHFVNFTRPQVQPVPFWDSTPLNGRFALVLEVRDHQISPPGPFPGDVAGTDQVVVWIDNQPIVGSIFSVGGLTGCGDLVLSSYLGTTAAITGQAWDPPIDPTAVQQQPNDNFGQYSLTFQKNGDPLATGTIIVSTNRVPNLWPGPLGGAFGTLADWDIVTALDGGTGPLPLHSPKLLRGQRCAYVITLNVNDTTHVGDSGINHATGDINWAVEVINDLS